MSGRSGGGCIRSLIGGCIGCAVVAVVVIVGLWMSRDAIRQSHWYKGLQKKAAVIQEEAKSLMALRQELIAKYPAERIEVQVHVNSVNGKSSRMLRVEIVNPTFALPDDDAAKQAKAHEIAAFVARVHPGISHYDVVGISFSRGGGAGVTFSSRADFEFPVSDLLPAGTPPAASGTVSSP